MPWARRPHQDDKSIPQQPAGQEALTRIENTVQAPKPLSAADRARAERKHSEGKAVQLGLSVSGPAAKPRDLPFHRAAPVRTSQFPLQSGKETPADAEWAVFAAPRSGRVSVVRQGAFLLGHHDGKRRVVLLDDLGTGAFARAGGAGKGPH